MASRPSTGKRWVLWGLLVKASPLVVVWEPLLGWYGWNMVAPWVSLAMVTMQCAVRTHRRVQASACAVW